MTEQYSDSNKEPEGLDIRQYVALFIQWAWLIILATVLAGGAAFLVSKQMTPMYQASTIVMVNAAPSSQVNTYNSLITSQQLAGTYSKMFTAQPVLDAVAQQLKETGALGVSISVSPVTDTELLRITVTSTDPEWAAKVANTLVDVFAENIVNIQGERFAVSKQNLQKQISDMDEQIKSLETQVLAQTDTVETKRLQDKIDQYRQIQYSMVGNLEEVRLAESQNISTITQVEPAVPDYTPVSPQILRNTLLGALVGMLLGIAVVFLMDFLDDTLRSPDQITEKLGLPVLAVISHFNTEPGKPITESHPRSPVSEAFRTLRTNVQYTSVDRPLNTLLVTSSDSSEGKTTVAVNLSVVLAQGGNRVTLIDADMRHPSIHKRLDNPNRAGLSSLFVQGNETLNGSVQKTRIENLALVTAGDMPPNPSELLGSQKMNQILTQLKGISDILIIDSPPIMAVTDAAILGPKVDGVLLIVEPGKTRLAAARHTVEQMQRVGANLLGVVLNNLDMGSARYGYRYYYYKGYHYRYYNKYYIDEEGQRKPVKKSKGKAA
jgi:polysaccharide biosynthesis transport protein